MFTPLLVFLSGAMDMLNSAPLFSEERIMSCLNILSQTTDGEKPSQDWILKNVKIDQICMKLLVQKQSLTIAGQTCLFISQLTNGNPVAQVTFQTDTFAQTLVYLLDFNELVNESDPDMEVETL